MVGNNIESWSSENSLRILVASDIHLGYLENDPVRGEDSFIAFEEVLSQAVQYDVDFILLGGDLFDHAKPSPNCMFKCTELIRKYCFGDKPVNIEILSDQMQNFTRSVNYEDPNLNVSYPILSIHGNHDDPVGQGSISSLDILSITGLVNYFGKYSDYTHVCISPILLQKGETKLALYGLSHIKDQRLARLFAEKQVEMELLEDNNEWFNLLVLHQNRADRGVNNYIPEKVLPNFLDLVVWGHEHDSQVFPIRRQKSENDDFFVLQPGSTVATSLASGEALPKHCALLQIHHKEFMLTPIPLKTVRPFIFKTIVLSEENFDEESVHENEKVQTFLKEKVNEAIEEANKQLSGDPKQPTIPLVRLSVFFERESQDFGRMRFGQNFTGLVANPQDILIMKKEKKVRAQRKEKMEDDDIELGAAAVEAADVESLLNAYYAALPVERRLGILTVRAVTDAVKDFTMKHDDDIFKRVFVAHINRCVEFLLNTTAETEDEINEQMKLCKEALDSADDEQLKNLINTSVAIKPKPTASGDSKKGIVVLSSDEDEPIVNASRGRPSAVRGNRGAKAKAVTRGRGRGRGILTPAALSPQVVLERRTPRKATSPETLSPRVVIERRTPRRAAAQKTNSWIQSLITENKNTRVQRVSSDDSD